MKKLMTFAVAMVLAASMAWAYEALKCRYDSTPLWWNGKTRMVYGTLEYQCTCGTHKVWLTESDCSE